MKHVIAALQWKLSRHPFPFMLIVGPLAAKPFIRFCGHLRVCFACFWKNTKHSKISTFFALKFPLFWKGKNGKDRISCFLSWSELCNGFLIRKLFRAFFEFQTNFGNMWLWKCMVRSTPRLSLARFQFRKISAFFMWAGYEGTHLATLENLAIPLAIFSVCLCKIIYSLFCRIFWTVFTSCQCCSNTRAYEMGLQDK